MSDSLRPHEPEPTRSPPGFSAHEISQSSILEWAAISFSRGSSLPRDQTASPALQILYCWAIKEAPERRHIGGIKHLRMGQLSGSKCVRAMRAKSLQPCPTLCNPMDCNPSGSSGMPANSEWNRASGLISQSQTQPLVLRKDLELQCVFHQQDDEIWGNNPATWKCNCIQASTALSPRRSEEASSSWRPISKLVNTLLFCKFLTAWAWADTG